MKRPRTGEVLDLVRRERASRTSELAAMMGLARSTVAERVGILRDLGLLVLEGSATTGPGRPAKILKFNRRAGVILAAHLGLTGMQVAMVDLGGEVLESYRVDIELRSGPQVVLDRIVTEFKDLLRRCPDQQSWLFGIGIGIPGTVELNAIQGGRAPGKDGWGPGIVEEGLQASFDVPVFVEQDVNFLAIGEHDAYFPDAEVFMAVKVGTVIASGVLINGEPVRGARALAGEIGHTRIPGSNAPCACGKRGCLNAVAGAGALAAALSAQGHPTAHVRDVVALARDGVVDAAQAVRQAGREIGEVLAAAVNLLNPSAIVFWGYLADAGDHLMAGVRETIFAAAVSGATEQLTLEPVRSGDDAGILGAAMTVVKHQLTPVAVDALVAQSNARRR